MLWSTLLTLAALSAPQTPTTSEADRLRTSAEAALIAGQDDRALAIARRAWRLEPGHQRTRELQTIAIVRLGSRLMASKDFKRARDLFAEGLAIDPHCAALCLGTGQASKELHEVEVATRHFRRATEFDPELAPAFLALGAVLYEQHDFEGAGKALQRAVELEPQNDLARTLLQRVTDDRGVEKSFSRHKSAHFELAYNGDRRGLDRFQPEILAYLESCYAKMRDLLRREPKRPIRVLLYTRTEFQTLNRNADWVQAYYDGKVRIPVDSWQACRSRVEAAIRHELTHAFVQEVYGTMSAWLHEGFAQRIEGLDKKTALREFDNGTLVEASRLRRPFVMERNPVRARRLYAQSFLLFVDIESRLGSRGLAPLFERIVKAEGKTGDKEDAAFESLLGVKLDALIQALATTENLAAPGR